MLLRRTMLVPTLLAVAAAGCAQVRPAHEQVPMDVADVMYDEPVETLADLTATSDAVVLAQPLDGEEAVLLDLDGIQVLGRTFRVVRAVHGRIAAGDSIVVARPRYGVSPEMQSRLNRQGLEATPPPDSATDNPAFTRPLYLLGLDSTGDDYGTPAWTPANGPHSRVAFDTADLASATAVVEVEGTPLQEGLAGRSVRDILRRLLRR